MSLPKQCLYNRQVNPAYSRNFQSNIQPQNGSAFSYGETVIFNVPSAPNLVMSGADTTLKCTFNYRTTGATVALMDRGGIASVIQRLRIFHGSTLLCDIDDYGNLASMMTTIHESSDSCLGKLAVLQGTAGVAGKDLSGAGAGNVSLNFNFSLLSILSLTNNYIPLFAMVGSPMRIELQLVSDVKKVVASDIAIVDNPNFKTLTNVELVCNMMEISDEGMQKIRAASGQSGTTQWVVNDYRNYSHNAVLGTAQTQVSVPIPAKFNSLRALYWTFRENSAGVLTHFPNESHRFGLQEYTLRVGAQVIPAISPKSVPQFLSELLRSVGSVGDVNLRPNITALSYDSAAPAAVANAAAVSGSFYCGIDLESYSNTDMSSVYNGMNTSTDDIFFNPVFDAQANATNIRINSYALYDSLIVFKDGAASVF